MCNLISLEGQVGKYLKEERTVESQGLLKQDNYQLPLSTSLNYNKASLKEDFLYKILLPSQVILQHFSNKINQPSNKCTKYAGGHTLGFAHCSSFQNRIHKFNPKQGIDPSLDPSFAKTLQSKCHIGNKVKNAGSPLDSSATYFDNAYYKLLVGGKSILSSDQALLTHPTTKALVSKYADSQIEFERAFVKSMIKMSSITNGGQEIRLQCNLIR